MMYSVKQIAELLQVGVPIVAAFVDSGELDAIDVSLKRGKRRLRIPEDALRQFLDRRRVFVPPPRRRGRTYQPKPSPMIDYFAVGKLEENGRRRLKVTDVAEHLGVKPDYVRQLIAYGHLTAVNVGGPRQEHRYRIAEKELFAFIESSRNEPKLQRAARLRGPDFLLNLPARPTEPKIGEDQK